MRTVAFLGIKRFPALAGADRVVEQIVNNLSRNVKATLYVRRESSVTYECRDALSFVVVPTIRSKHAGPFLYFFLCVAHFLVKGNADVVHVHNSDLGILVPFLRLKPGVRIIGTLHGRPYDRGKWSAVARMFLRVSEWFFLRSCHVVTSVSRVTGMSKHIEYVPNGIELDLHEDESAKELLTARRLMPGEYLLFAAGRLDRTKGLHLVLHAMKRTVSSSKLLVIADFSHDRIYSEEIRNIARNMDNVVLYERLVPKEQLYYLLGKARVFIFPSEVEAMSMMLLEAIASKTLVVASDIPENTDVLGRDYPLIFRSGDIGHLAEVLTNALSGVHVSLANNKYVECSKQFGWDKIVARYEQLYLGHP